MGQIIGDMLRLRHLVSQEQFDEAVLLAGADHGRPVEQVLLENKLIDEEDYLRAVSVQLGYDYVTKIAPDDIDPDVMALLPLDYLRKHQLLPLHRGAGDFRVATANPLDPLPLDALKTLLKSNVVPVLATGRMIDAALAEYVEHQTGVTRRAIADLQSVDASEIKEIEASVDLTNVAQKAPIVNLVNSILHEALLLRASDIHVEPFETHIKVRFRVDGVLCASPSPPKAVQAALISRIKIQSGLDIAESRLPQDGHMKISMGSRKLDIRVSILPCTFGERVVMRILDHSRTEFSLTSLGLLDAAQARFHKLLERPHGIILVTGPTGSGKSTTLYAALTSLSSGENNVLTVEDPVENEIRDVSQMQVKPQIGLTFAAGLRSILRQDPDVIMVGEIRDHETAEISVQASLTGHLVLSTLHTNDAAGSITRLIDMGIEPYLIASSVVCVLAQRLVRLICVRCKTPLVLSEELRREYRLNAERLASGRGCDACRTTGYRGRIGIFELLVVDDGVRELIAARTAAGIIRSRCIAAGMSTLREDGFRKVDSGLTTIEEVARVTQD